MARQSLTRAEFLQAFADLQLRFDSNRRFAGSREQAFRDAMDCLQRETAQDPAAGSPLAPEDPARLRLDADVARIRAVVAAWTEGIRKGDSRAEFRDETGDSLLVFVYGKVKAGKSSLGNYIARGYHDPGLAGGAQSGPVPEFFVRHSTGRTEATGDREIRERGQFGVDDMEATSAIQGFRLPGLTWVDSPGLHSKTEENGQLAKDYVEAADLVLYVTSSEAPGRRSDILELQQLGQRELPLAVLVTGSDCIDEDVDERGEVVARTVMKAEADRRAQLAYIRRVLDESADDAEARLEARMAAALRKADAFSVSVWYAQENADATGMEASGVGAMLHHVAALAQRGAVQAKVQRPLRNMRHFLDRVQAGELPELKEALAAAAKQLAAEREQARQTADKERKLFHGALGRDVAEAARKHAMDNVAFRLAINTALNRRVQDGIKGVARAFGVPVDGRRPCAPEEFGLPLPEFQQRWVDTPRRKTVASKYGKAVGIAALGLVTIATGGTGAVALAAGAAASAAGGYAGGKIGGLLDGHEWVRVLDGDNRDEVAVAARERAQAVYTDRIGQVIGFMEEARFAAGAQWMEQVMDRVRDVERQTLTLLDEIDAHLDSSL